MAEGEVTISELELADEVLADMVVAVDTTTDTKSVSLRQLRAWLGSSLPTGFIIPAVGRISDERFTLLDGKTLARDGTYQAFCNKVVSEVQAGNWFACTAEEYEADLTNHGQCGRFVITNDYIRIPTITKFMGATITLSQIGQAESAGLPQIQNSGSLVTYIGSGGTAQLGTGTTTTISSGNISPIYGNSDTVTPENIKYPYYMVVSTEGQTSAVEFDVNQIYEDMNLKADQAYVDARTPTGTILPYGGSTAPSGFLLCNGGAISRTTYARLFSVIGTTYGVGDGSTTFNLPNLIGLTSDNVPCKGNGMALGYTNGTKNFTTTFTGDNSSGNHGPLMMGDSASFGKNVGNYISVVNNNNSNHYAVGITTDVSKSGVVSSLSSASQKTLAIIKY